MGIGVYWNGLKPWMIEAFRDMIDGRWGKYRLHQEFLSYLQREYKTPEAYLLNYTEDWVWNTFKGG